MAKGKAKSSSEGVAAPQARSLRSRKRERPSDEAPLTVDGETPVHQQDSEGNNAAVVSTHMQSHESLVQECATITNQLPLVAEQSRLTKNDDSNEEKEKKASEELVENSTTCPNSDSQLQGCIINTEDDTNKDGKKQRNPQEVSDTCADHQVQTSEDGDGSCADALEKPLGAKKKSHCNLERSHESSQEEPNHMCMDDFKEVAQESVLRPVRKKRRMGMCGLTEKERSHFLQIQKREIGQNGVENVEKQLCNNNADLVAQEDVISPAPLLSSPLDIPVESASAQGKAEIKLQSGHCGVDTRSETEVPTLDGTSALWNSGCSEGKTSEAEEVTDPEQTNEPKSHQPAEKTMDGHSASLKQQEQEETTVYTKTSQNEETEKKKDGNEVDTLQVYVTDARDEMVDNNGAEAGATSTDSGGFNRGCVELCETPETPSYSEKKAKCAPDGELAAGSSTVNSEHNETGHITESFGSQCFDYVSDSQLNTIALIEEKRMETEEDPGSSYCPKDATNLICGLIRELSSLNRKVMATHRELESLRRGSKTSRSSTH